MNVMRRMRLYQHSARCSVALRTFLDCNPNYWCFIPMRSHTAKDEDRNAIREAAENTATVTSAAMSMNMFTMQRLDTYLDRVPFPPGRYRFSYRQHRQQRLFFENLISLSRGQKSYSTIDLYQFSVIALRK